MLSALHRAALVASRIMAITGAGLLIGGMMVTVADVILRRTTNTAIDGTVDITQLFIMVVVFLSLPYAFLNGSQVSVEAITDKLPPRGIALVKAVGALLGAAFMALVAWYGGQQALLQYEYGDISQTIGIPILWYWMPLLVGSAFSVLTTALVGIAELATAVTGKRPDFAPGSG
jgi:TRAP-type C4-dicarboxylate transport system permease small subunit